MRLDERLRFDTLVVGAANRLAVTAARAVAESPGRVHNPLFIYGASGLGKTHLLGGIGRLARQLDPSTTVEYITLVELVEEYHAAVAAGETSAWGSRWRDASVLLIDDIQFLTGRRETQAELLRAFSAMQQQERQLVLTSDRPPSDIADVDERLIARFSGGLVVDIGAPDYETRAAILKTIASARDFEVGDELLNELARVEFANVRELQGALNRLVAHKAFGTGELRVEEALRALGLEAAASRGAAQDDFASFIADVTSAVQQHVDTWRARLSEAIAYWVAEGYNTGVLERALALPEAPDVDGLVRQYAEAVDHLKALEARAVEADGALRGDATFRNPEQLDRAEELVEQALAGQLPPPGPSPAFARAAFEVSTSNQLAVKAADAVAENPGQRFNPLLLHGPGGVGKTHLAHAIGNEIAARARGPLSVACVSGQRFVDELIAAIASGAVERWRHRYSAVAVLILDDVHLLSGKERSQEELFHVFNMLHSTGRQLVFTSDQPPRRIPGIEERLRSRFDGGLVVPIDAPDRLLRERIATRTLSEHGHAADTEVVRLLADQPVQNIRELVGVVHRLLAAAAAAGLDLTPSFARRELGPPMRLTPTRVTMRASDTTFLDREKVVWEWDEPRSRVIEEPR